MENRKSIVAPKLSSLIKSIETDVFPNRLKEAQVTPLHKKNNALDKTNYRPVSVLPIFSKIFEKVLEIQLGNFF